MTIDLDIPANLWLTANGRLHWAAKASRTKRIRRLALLLAQKHPAMGRANLHAVISYPTARRADPANASPTVKAALDGIVDAGVLDDDDHVHVPETTYSRGPDTGRPGVYRVSLRLEPLP